MGSESRLIPLYYISINAYSNHYSPHCAKRNERNNKGEFLFWHWGLKEWIIGLERKWKNWQFFLWLGFLIQHVIWIMWSPPFPVNNIRDLSEISRGDGGAGVETEGGSTFWDCRKGRGHEKWVVKRGRVTQICVRDHVEVHPQKKKEVLYFVKKTWEK